jgi:ankyrin repeat protein
MEETTKAALLEIEKLLNRNELPDLEYALATYKDIPNFRLIILLSNSTSKTDQEFERICEGLNDQEKAVLAAVETNQSDMSNLSDYLQSNPEIASLMLIKSLSSSKWNISESLLNSSAKLDYQDLDGNTALHALAMTYDVDEQKISELLTLIKQKDESQVASLAGLSNNGGATALHFATLNSNGQMIKWLIENGADISQRSNENQTSLDIAVQNNNAEMVLEILQAYSDKGIFDEKTAIYQRQTRSKNKDGYDIVIKTEEFPVINWAILGHKFELSDYLINKHNFDVNKVDDDGKTVLHDAAKNGDRYVIQYLINNGADISVVDREGKTALHYAAGSGRADAVQWLIDNKADIKAVDKAGNTMLHYAAQSGNLDVIEFLIKNDADVNAINRNGKTALHYAAQSGNVDLVKYLISIDANIINDVDIDGKTTLHYAALSGNIDLVKYLIEKGAKAQDRDKSDKTVLQYAAESGNVELVKYLNEKYNLDKYHTGGIHGTVLHIAAKSGNVDLVKYLIEKGAKAEARDKSDKTVLQYAAASGNVELVRYLIEKHNLDKYHTGGIHGTVLHIAAKSGNVDVIDYLISKESNVINAIDHNGKTALHYTVFSSNLDMVKYLIDNKVDINADDGHGRTALNYAAYFGKTDIVEVLLENNASIDGVTSDKPEIAVLLEAVKAPDQMLASGAKEGDLTKVKIALGRGADLEKKDPVTGKTPIELSRQSNNTEVTTLLEETQERNQYIKNSLKQGITSRDIKEVSKKIASQDLEFSKEDTATFRNIIKNVENLLKSDKPKNRIPNSSQSGSERAR